jgi:hypothetical protein
MAKIDVFSYVDTHKNLNLLSTIKFQGGKFLLGINISSQAIGLTLRAVKKTIAG